MFRKKIVTFGGGTGHFYLLDGLKRHNDPSLMTAIVGSWDSGGSSGRLRSELGVLPPGDIRRCILALMEDPDQQRVAQRLFDDRLGDLDGMLKGHSFGNLIGARLDHMFRGQDRGTDAERALFRIRARIMPACLTDLKLIAVTEKGITIEGEADIDHRCKRSDFDPHDKIARIYFQTRADANPNVLDAIKHADKIIFSPGDLFTSILPHLLIDGVKEALCKSKAKIYFVLNIMTKPGETDNFIASHFLEKIAFYLGDKNRLDYVIVNHARINSEILNMYRAEGQGLVRFDEKRCQNVVPKAKVVKTKLVKYLAKEHLLRHDSERLAEIILHLS